MSTVVDDEVIILGTAVVEGGVANLVVEPISAPTPLKLTILGHNKVTYINTDIIAAPAEGPYVVAAGYTVPAAGKLTYISNNTEIEVTLKNVGVEATGALTATISCDDDQLIIVNNTATCGSIAPDGTATVTFKVTVANDIPDNKNFLLDLMVTEGSKASWPGKLPVKAFAPNFSLEKVLINGVEDGNLGKGVVATITAMVTNKGGADAFNVKGDLEIDSEYIILACADEIIQFGQPLPAGETIELFYTIITAPEMPYGHEANFDLLLNAQYEREATLPFTASCTGSDNYCSSGTQNCSLNDRFTLVQLYKTSDPANFLINNSHSVCSSSSGYEDFTNTIIELEPGAQYNIKVNVSTGGLQHIGGWFDLNGNNVFDTNEKLIAFTCPSGGTNNQTFTIPADNFVPGTYRFRLVCKWNSAPTANGCGNSSYGQTHDYTIVLPELYPRVQNVAAVLLGDDIEVTWGAPEEGTPIGYNVYRNGERKNETLLTVTNFTEENIEQGVYAYNVTAVYEGNKESFAEMSNVICNFMPPQLCEIPADLLGTPHDEICSIAVVTWNEPEIDGILLHYNIYRDGEKIAETQPDVLEYLDEDLEDGIYVYQVAAFYEHCEESERAEGVTVIINCVGIQDVQVSSFEIFPNPTTGEVTMRGEGLSRVEFYDIQGRKLNEYNATGKLQINVNHLNNGIYFVKMYSGTNMAVVKRMVIMRD